MKKLFLFLFVLYLCKFAYWDFAGYKGVASKVVNTNRYIDINSQEDVDYIESKIVKDSFGIYRIVELLNCEEI